MSRRKATITLAETDAVEKVNPFRGAEKRMPGSILLSSSKRVFIRCLAMRMLNSLLVQTYFNPDEHWQALEVAHRITFGYGHLTWEWKKGIRSSSIQCCLRLCIKFLHSYVLIHHYSWQGSQHKYSLFHDRYSCRSFS